MIANGLGLAKRHEKPDGRNDQDHQNVKSRDGTSSNHCGFLVGVPFAHWTFAPRLASSCCSYSLFFQAMVVLLAGGEE